MKNISDTPHNMKRTARLFEILGQLDDSLIEQAHSSRAGLRRWQKWVAVAAACVVIATGIGSAVLYKQTTSLPVQPSATEPVALSPLTMSEDEFFGDGGWGPGEIDWAWSIDELTNQNPWTPDADLSVLPVFPPKVSGSGELDAQNLETLKQQLDNMADLFGINVNDLDIDYYPDEQDLQQIYEKLPAGASTDSVDVGGAHITATDEQREITISVYDSEWSIQTSIEFPDAELPALDQEDPQSCLRFAQAVQAKYPQLLQGMHININGGAYNVYGEQIYSFDFYKADGDLTDQMIGYHYNRIICIYNDGMLYLKMVYTEPVTKEYPLKIGDYPIITQEQALRMLANGQYFTSVVETFPGVAYVCKTELCYHRSGIPCYLFYVRLPDHVVPEEGMQSFGLYYVPAISQKYLKVKAEDYHQQGK